MQAWDESERVADPLAVPSSFVAASWEVSFSSQGADASFAGTCPSQVAATAWSPVSPGRGWQCMECRARGGCVSAVAERGGSQLLRGSILGTKCPIRVKGQPLRWSEWPEV